MVSKWIDYLIVETDKFLAACSYIRTGKKNSGDAQQAEDTAAWWRYER